MVPTMLDKETTKPAAADLRAAIEAIVSRLEPDQIILFGSAARGEMTDDSDLDLLVIKNGQSDADELHIGRSCGRNGLEMDVIVTSSATAEASRPYAGNVKGHALETGRTVYAKKDFEPIATGPTLTRVGGRMVQRTLYKPDHAGRFLARAERKWGIATTTKLHPADRCENLQAAMEQALKGLIVAQGRHVEHRHDLNRLWDEAERDGERIAVSRDPPSPRHPLALRREVPVRRPGRRDAGEDVERHENHRRRRDGVRTVADPDPRGGNGRPPEGPDVASIAPADELSGHRRSGGDRRGARDGIHDPALILLGGRTSIG